MEISGKMHDENNLLRRTANNWTRNTVAKGCQDQMSAAGGREIFYFSSTLRTEISAQMHKEKSFTPNGRTTETRNTVATLKAERKAKKKEKTIVFVVRNL